jgi:hypothetical protein
LAAGLSQQKLERVELSPQVVRQASSGANLVRLVARVSFGCLFFKLEIRPPHGQLVQRQFDQSLQCASASGYFRDSSASRIAHSLGATV